MSVHVGDLDALLSGLNEPQRDAVVHGEGPLLILAGAGSGKTRVLTHRIAYLVGTGQARPDEILAITFTNKAAQEMRERVELLVGRRTRAMWVMTFHAACARMLRADAHRLGYTRQFTIYDQSDARRLVKRCIDELDIDPKRFTPGAIHHEISDAKNKLRDAEAYARLVGSFFEQTVADVYKLYEAELHRMNAMDFDDLLVRAVNLMELFPEVRERYQRAFRWVLVDEYQDTNHVQYRWLQLIAGEHRNLAVVGDDSQSIYGFRGADIRNILDFEDDYPDAKVVKLEQNYRSTQTILDAANAVIRNNRGQREKELWTDLGAGDPIKVRELEDEHAEARFVAGEIERIVDEGVSRNEIAVFYRTNSQSRVLEDTLVRAQIGYQVIGGTKFYERAEIKDAIAYLTLLVNPQDVVAFTRIANSPRRGIGQTSLSRVISWANTAGITIWEAALDPDAIPALGTAARKAFHRFMGSMRILRERLESEPPVGELLREVLAESGYLDALEAERTIEAQGRIENLEELVNVAVEYDQTVDLREEPPSLAGFLQQIALVADADGRRDDEGLVTLMTLHNAKGLEYPIVFLLGMEEGVFPHQRSIEEGGLEEERRLAYVGITRAMRDLYLTYARTRAVFGSRSFGARSRFVDEVPIGLTDRNERPALGVGNVRARATSWGAPSPNLSPLGSGPIPGGGWNSGAGAGGSGGSDYRLGDDVVHAAFGEGVVVGVEAGGIVVIRFARDHSERKLVADLAPIEKR
ncbi:UvrD-helicase domain-containing protein [Conexibacter sp. JD483]|uniref:ATP-dependent helicase n=1 Tax=unclassified Conexibacter TaxID=2627773 RepID=UPI0027280C8F|nr:MULTISPECIES: UvrD-helicase domain-containing protein [unclassified Conexibacter]MDO8185739.1 UvrD-helicase domain-containing protein [Conexibacter sp. CPCC 205706]MDO8199116.1 UvrD-helicase domain-containing protein [Conexibacter sp. CPCC 205762]MDR9370970.1 UvrD-helicase domain-containing protein [Conexibacter sp. JD483]